VPLVDYENKKLTFAYTNKNFSYWVSSVPIRCKPTLSVYLSVGLVSLKIEVCTILS